VDLDSKPEMGVGHHWGWETAGGEEKDSLNVSDCLGEVALSVCSDGGGALGMYSGYTGSSFSGSPCRTGLVSFWSLSIIVWAMKTLLYSFLLAQNQTQEDVV
jgi:hypothetical protein